MITVLFFMSVEKMLNMELTEMKKNLARFLVFLPMHPFRSVLIIKSEEASSIFKTQFLHLRIKICKKSLDYL